METPRKFITALIYILLLQYSVIYIISMVFMACNMYALRTYFFNVSVNPPLAPPLDGKFMNTAEKRLRMRQHY